MNYYSPWHPHQPYPPVLCAVSHPSRRWVVTPQGLFGDLIQVAHTVLVHHGHSEVGQVDDQSLLDLLHALLEDVVRLLLGQLCGHGGTGISQ